MERIGDIKAIGNNLKLVDAYNHWFDVIRTDTPSLLEQAYRLRYQVYCKENNFENPDDHPLEQETDEFDARSTHTLLLDRASRSIAGTVRLILPSPEEPGRSFPIQKVCNHPLVANRKLLLTARAAEISRFAISKEFRQAVENLTHQQHNFLSAGMKMLMPCITLGLMKGILRMSIDHGITDLFAVMEPSLLRLLSRHGIYFRPIGPLVDYHGKRQSCHVEVETLLTRVRKERLDVWEIITDEGKLLQRMRKNIHLCC